MRISLPRPAFVVSRPVCSTGTGSRIPVRPGPAGGAVGGHWRALGLPPDPDEHLDERAELLDATFREVVAGRGAEVEVAGQVMAPGPAERPDWS
ncbi:hypothetical protein F1721_11625 [Saccharopolyspora hirsuta]|uniref:Uncharacterized protein n=1 Tax=Saccharopolyspora hirsuta TaxID=1837 RepID=A0A5M7BYU9_SACHI|nr:hypothetical protein F1721_11625 [Saccharopolyspora hirsuta]